MNGRILVVDDDPEILSLLRRGLTYEGYVVEEALDGKEALAKARERPPDLVVLDVMMPGLDGLEVCQRMRQAFVIAVLALAILGTTLGLALASSATQPQSFTVYLPWVQHTGEVRISILPTGGRPIRLDPERLTVRPGTVVAWTNKTRVPVAFWADWGPSGFMQPEETFRLAFTTVGTFNYRVEKLPGSLLSATAFGTVIVAE